MPNFLAPVWVIARRELAGYFATPVALVFIVIFLAVSGALTFYVGGFLERGQASLDAFFLFHPWLYLLLIPALSMRLWAEERKSGSAELLMTLPLSVSQAVLGKFLAAWAFAGVALALTFPMWLTVNILGDPDNGVIVAGYLGSFAMAGAFLAVGGCMSALTTNQVIAFILGAAVCFLFTMSGVDMVLDLFRAWAPPLIVDSVAGLSFLTHFNALSQGVIGLADVIFFASMIVFWQFATVLAVSRTRGA
ncbi:ABC transporter permease [Roseospirillum parvum]|uniref:ABC-2 type transport system permease protein n=1 Tax=Roseospirillum parvum TaxID=83401 RepID=A0A1G8B8G5_9PROT|nr:ABC transporter permease [Roseospirillum parvum]SDH29542.1 ABC-2 type transport system permease protein [Roseospirillum parvum]